MPTNLTNPPLPEDENDRQDRTGRFIRQREDRRNRERWGRLLRDEHGIRRDRPVRSGRRLLLPLLAAAATVLLLVFVLPLFGPDKGPVVLTELLDQREMAATYRAEAPSDTTALVVQELHQSYAARDYSAVLDAGERLARQEALTDRERYYLGLAAFYDGRLRNAIDYFKPLTEIDLYRSVSYYHIGLAYLRANHVADGLQALREVREDSPRHFRQATALLEAEW